MRSILKKLVNSALRPLGARAVSHDWGPRGFIATFQHAKMAGLDPHTIIDVGASDGRWSAECMSVFPNANYCLFDALPEHASDLSSFARLHPRVKYWNGALGRTDGTAELHAHGHQSSILKSSEFGGVATQVNVRALDSFIETMNIQGPSILKADVQGFELEVLAGATRCLESAELVLLEVSFRRMYDCSPLADEVISAMSSLGFRVYDISSYAQRPLDGALAQADVAFAKTNSALFGQDGWS